LREDIASVCLWSFSFARTLENEEEEICIESYIL